MRLLDLIDKNDTASRLNIPPDIDENTQVLGLSSDSRTVLPGYLFAALSGAEHDGAAFIEQAVKRGAHLVLTERKTVTGAACLHSANPRQALASLAAKFFAPMPATIIAVTGTNGKTSVAEFYRQIVAGLGMASASLGTLGITAPTYQTNLQHTTPEPVTLHASLRDLAFSGVTHLAMEASSHGLAQYRLDGVRVAAAAFTNLSRDHLDYHQNEVDYFAAKQRLFTHVLADDGVAVINLLGDGGEKMRAACLRAGRQIFCIGGDKSGSSSGVDLELSDVVANNDGLTFNLTYENKCKNISLPMVGAFQAENFAVSVGLCLASLASLTPAVSFEDIISGAANVTGVKGRMEAVAQIAQTAQTENNARVYVDYAHTPDALENVLVALRPHTQGRLICVFGCGGNRDTGKRELMGAIAATYADIVIVTDDNPRDENADAIRAEVMVACPGAIEISARGDAIAHAINLAHTGDGDVVLVAGKGHETGQIIGDKILPFSDHETIRSVIKEAGQ